jgi:von Willebrand factor A domain-containing protein 8
MLNVITAFLGNHFLQVLGDNFSLRVEILSRTCQLKSNMCYRHAVMNPDINSERRLLAQLAPELDGDLALRLVGAFRDLRVAYENNALTYPYSLRGEFSAHPFQVGH